MIALPRYKADSVASVWINRNGFDVMLGAPPYNPGRACLIYYPLGSGWYFAPNGTRLTIPNRNAAELIAELYAAGAEVDVDPGIGWEVREARDGLPCLLPYQADDWFTWLAVGVRPMIQFAAGFLAAVATVIGLVALLGGFRR